MSGTDAELGVEPPPPVPLGDTGWRVWPDMLIRSTGFPVDGLDRFAAPDCAAVADAHLDGDAVSGEAYADAFAKAAAATSREAYAVACDPLFREAVTWQSTNSRHAIDGIRRGGPDERRRYKRRERETVLLRYWQRYCTKNETIGFFGPTCWGTVRADEPDGSADAPAVDLRPGPDLLRRREVFLEYWALDALTDQIAADEATEPWLPVAIRPHLWLDGRVVHRPTGEPVPVTSVEAAVLARCDGRAARDVADAAAEDPAGPRRAVDVYPMLRSLADRDLVRWGIDLPAKYYAERALVDWIATIGDPPVAERARRLYGDLAAARDRVAAAAGDPDRLAEAIDDLHARFTDLTGEQAHRRAGQAYAGRTPCLEETSRDLDFRVGKSLLDEIAVPLGVLLPAARWLTVAVGDAYRAALRELFAELDDGSGAVGMGELWYLAQGLLFGVGERPADVVAAEFTRRCAELFGLADAPAGERRRQLASADLAARVHELFPADRPGWQTARIHSPDLQICAESAAALRRGEYVVVLGEMHTAWATFDSGAFVAGHPDTRQLRAAMRRDLGADRPPHVLFPLEWPRFTPRLAHVLEHPADPQLAFADSPGADHRRLVPISSLTARDDGEQIVAVAPDGRSWTALDLMSELTAVHAVDAFRLLATRPHTPRVTIDRMVVSRETWRTTVGESGLAATGLSEADGYLTARRWRRSIGVPDQVFVRLGTETKPCYVDLTSPAHVASLRHMCRSARTAGGDGTSLVVTEMLPNLEQAWLEDGAGRRYFSELRMQICDPEVAAWSGHGS